MTPAGRSWWLSPNLSTLALLVQGVLALLVAAFQWAGVLYLDKGDGFRLFMAVATTLLAVWTGVALAVRLTGGEPLRGPLRTKRDKANWWHL